MKDIELEEFEDKKKKECYDLMAATVPNFESAVITMRKTLGLASAEIATFNYIKTCEERGISLEGKQEFLNVVYNTYLYMESEMISNN